MPWKFGNQLEVSQTIWFPNSAERMQKAVISEVLENGHGVNCEDIAIWVKHEHDAVDRLLLIDPFTQWKQLGNGAYVLDRWC
jgi:hypothetical protein